MMIMVIFIMLNLHAESVYSKYIFPKDVSLFLTDNANAVATHQTTTALRPASRDSITALTAEPTNASSPKAFGIPYPATSPLQPRRQTLAHKLPHAVDNGVDHRRMAMAHAVHCQGACHSIQGDHLSPGYSFVRGRETHRTQLSVDEGPL